MTTWRVSGTGLEDQVMMVREPVVAGMFYPADETLCRRQLAEMVPPPTEQPAGGLEVVCGGIVPHAGWMYSGRVCGQVVGGMAGRCRPETVVLLGAAHRRVGRCAVMFAGGAWQSPLGLVPVDGRLAERVLAGTSLIEADPYSHEGEHSIEVLVPFVRHAWPDAKILPILVEPTSKAVEIGEAVARTARDSGASVVYLGSTDLTHYGPRYGFVPEGPGARGIVWAKQINDVRLIEVIRQMRAEAVVGEVAEHANACGAGAIAATVAACRLAGAARGVLLSHVSSIEIEGGDIAQGSDAVGYAGIVFE